MKAKRKSRIKWMKFEELPVEAQPLALAINRHWPLHNTSNIIRLASGGERPRLFVQVPGRFAAARLAALDRELAEVDGGCLVEVDALAPGTFLLMLFGGVGRSEEVQPEDGFARRDGQPTGYRFRPLG
jgi:hypothetical protein